MFGFLGFHSRCSHNFSSVGALKVTKIKALQDYASNYFWPNITCQKISPDYSSKLIDSNDRKMSSVKAGYTLTFNKSLIKNRLFSKNYSICCLYRIQTLVSRRQGRTFVLGDLSQALLEQQQLREANGLRRVRMLVRTRFHDAHVQ